MKSKYIILFFLFINQLSGTPKVANASFANKVILEIEDPSNGEKIDMEILSYSHSLLMPLVGAKQDPSFQANFQDFKISRFGDLHTSYFYQKCVSGERIPQVTLSYFKVLKKENSSYQYIQIQLKNVLVTSVSIGGGADIPIETIAFAYKQIYITISTPSKTNRSGFDSKTFSYDLTLTH
ncbi:MAG: type VI secretion system tube protein Hcp [Spirochaetia bacterium]|nr:type VI secretion system tube protein Hcp [Spirochaetia bacterium]